MSLRASVARSLGLRIEQHSRAVLQLQIMMADFDRLANDLDRDIRAEEARTNNNDPLHFAYSTVAKAAAQRRDNLRRSSNELRVQLEAAKKALSEAELEAAKLLDQSAPIEAVAAEASDL